jgi:hypothetical protein
MHRLHEGVLAGHVLGQEPWEVVSFPAIAEQDQTFVFETPLGTRRVTRKIGMVLHPERESKATLDHLQYQQAPAPLGGGIVKAEWFRTYEPHQLPEKFERIVQSCGYSQQAQRA